MIDKILPKQEKDKIERINSEYVRVWMWFQVVAFLVFQINNHIRTEDFVDWYMQVSVLWNTYTMT